MFPAFPMFPGACAGYEAPDAWKTVDHDCVCKVRDKASQPTASQPTASP